MVNDIFKVIERIYMTVRTITYLPDKESNLLENLMMSCLNNENHSAKGKVHIFLCLNAVWMVQKMTQLV